MRILCDQHVPNKYVEAFQQVETIEVTTVQTTLQSDAADADIAAYAARNDWVVFTNDDDFFVVGGNHGLLLYDQLEDPTPGDVVTAIQKIDQVYTDPSEIIETVPGGWLPD